MDGIIYPEIDTMSNANKGGFLSNQAASQLAAFKTQASKDRYKWQTVTKENVTSANVTIPYTAPNGYTQIGAFGGRVAGSVRYALVGERANASNVYVYTRGGLYADIKNSHTTRGQILFRRT